MRYCSQCGTQNVPDAKFCSGCGAVLEAAPAQEAAAPAPEVTPAADPAPQVTPAPAPAPQPTPAPTYQQSYQQPYQQPYQASVDTLSAKCRTFGIIGFILGIFSTVFCWFGILPGAGIVLGIFTLAAAIVGLIFTNISKKEGNFKLASVGKVFSIIGLVLSAIMWTIGIIITAVAVGGNY